MIFDKIKKNPLLDMNFKSYVNRDYFIIVFIKQ